MDFKKNNWFTFLLQECTDSNVLGNLLAISRELLAARSLWRPSALGTFLAFEATEIIGRLLVRVCKPVTNSTLHQPSLSDHSFVCCFWILSALATKGIKKVICMFSVYTYYSVQCIDFDVKRTPCPTKVKIFFFKHFLTDIKQILFYRIQTKILFMKMWDHFLYQVSFVMKFLICLVRHAVC